MSSLAPSITSSSAAGFGAPAPPTRLDRTTACLPIVYGSVAFYLGKKADDYQTHQWTLYLRGPSGDEDLSPVISKVIFQLHPSFAQPTRELTEPPFEVTERGWGEFEAQIRIVWKDPLEKATLVVHPIKLYPPGTPINTIPESADPVVSESYDEVVFTDPTETFFAQLQRVAVGQTVEYSQREHFTPYSDHDLSTALLEAQKFLQHELEAVKTRLLTVEVETQQVDAALREQARLMPQQHRAAAAARSNAAAAPAAAAASTSPPAKKAKSS